MEEVSIEEIITDTPPEDLDEIMEWVFGDFEADRESEEESGIKYLPIRLLYTHACCLLQAVQL